MVRREGVDVWMRCKKTKRGQREKKKMVSARGLPGGQISRSDKQPTRCAERSCPCRPLPVPHLGAATP